MNFKTIISNRIIIYLTSRYITYGLQFLTSILIAAKLGPYYMGVWGFILLILNYFQQINFGIGNSFNVLFVHNKGDKLKQEKIVYNALFLTLLLCVCATSIFFLYSRIERGGTLDKYSIEIYVLWICVIAVLQYIQSFLINLFRVLNKLLLVAISQSLVILLQFIAVFISSGESLISLLLSGYVLGLTVIVLLALANKSIDVTKFRLFDVALQKSILKKGVWLFLYNTCFYFIVISIRTLVSSFYNVDEFGLFTFSFTLANAFLLFLDSLSFVVFPKVLGKLSGPVSADVLRNINEYRTNYITVAHVIIYCALPLIPAILHFLPDYNGALQAAQLTSLGILMYTNCSGFSELLIAQNKEKLSAIISCSALVLNIVIAYVLIYIFHVPFSYSVFSIMVTYAVLDICVITCGNKVCNVSRPFVEAIKRMLTYKQTLPYLIAVLTCIHDSKWYIQVFPLMLYILFNKASISKLLNTTIKLIHNPNSVNL